MEPVRLLQFTDTLCVWAYVSQIRIDRLEKQMGAQLVVESRFCSVFGDAHAKLSRRWKDRGGLSAYGAHVRDVVAGFDHVEVHPGVWREVAPLSSLACHLFLCAIRHAEGQSESGVEPGSFRRACWATREAFFRDLQDVSSSPVLYGIAENLQLPRVAIEQALASGAAHAELASDFALARDYSVQASPSLVLNEGRQRLSGNVGFRVIEANVRELLHRPSAHDASWC